MAATASASGAGLAAVPRGLLQAHLDAVSREAHELAFPARIPEYTAAPSPLRSALACALGVSGRCHAA
jgi:hypothetical protein